MLRDGTTEVRAAVETTGFVEDMYDPSGRITAALANRLGIDPAAGWRMIEVVGDSSGVVTVKMFRRVPARATAT